MLGFLYDLGCTFTHFCVGGVYGRGHCHQKKCKMDRSYPACGAADHLCFVGAYMHDLGAFLFLLIPVVLCLAAYFSPDIR